MKKNNHLSPFIMGIAALLPLCLFIFPLWRISLYAPQYPDGVTIYLWINNITGATEGALQNINILNHYVGMGVISTESFPEFQYMSYIILSLTGLGLLSAFFNKRLLFLLWSSMFSLIGLIGIYDFYSWEYKYGHMLSPEAPIKVPGMAYQPPLFGTKVLLNFVAESYPSWGSLFVFISISTAFLLYIFKNKL